jgi:ABC-2 type transport system ATP-binding protein
MIEVRNLTKTYGSFVAVNGISFKAERGQILGFLGPNGAGKTTTMRIITGYMPATSGTVVINGLDIFTNSLEARGLIGYLPETPPLYSVRLFRQLIPGKSECQDWCCRRSARVRLNR